MGSTCCHSAMSLGIPGPCASSLPHQSGPGHLQELLWTKYRIVSCSIKSNSLRPHGLEPTRLLYSWNFPGKNTGVGCHFPLQGIFLTQGSNPCLLRLLCWQMGSLLPNHQGSPSTGGQTPKPNFFSLVVTSSCPGHIFKHAYASVSLVLMPINPSLPLQALQGFGKKTKMKSLEGLAFLADRCSVNPSCHYNKIRASTAGA